MRRGDKAILVFTMLTLFPGTLLSQTPGPPSLEEQLRAQYEPGTVLTIQKEGILGVASTSTKTCAARYQDSKLNPSESSCAASVKVSSRVLTVGEKIYPSKIDVDLAKERISFRIVECDSCNKGSQSSSYKSQIDFQFGKGYLQNAGVPQIEDTIGEVLAFGESADQQSQQAQGTARATGEQTAGMLTNNDIVKMAKAKLGDVIIIDTIKTSACNFDTSVDDMVKLKNAGVSDAVIKVMRDAQNEAQAAGHYICQQNNSWYLDLRFDNTFFLNRRSELNGTYDVSGDMVTLRYPPGQTSNLTLQGERLIDRAGNAWVKQPEPQPTSASAQVANFSVRHRHRTYDIANWKTVDSYCSGTLSISPDGTVAYDCTQTDDPSGRCEHLSFAPGALKQAKIGSAGSLHVESKTQGKFDFYGDQNDIEHALAAITPLIQTSQK